VRIAPIPVQVITGFLGSGKTTLLNELLANECFENTAVIINEFGEIGLDHLLVEKGDDTIIELSNGCLCCTVRGQLIETLETVIERRPDRILIETTGLADPVPVLQALIGAPGLSDRLEFAGLFTVFDAINGVNSVNSQREAERQLALADCIILSKTDKLAESSSRLPDDLMDFIRQHNPAARIVEKAGFLAKPEIMLDHMTSTAEAEAFPPDHHHHHDVNRHSNTVSCTQLICETPIQPAVLDAFLDLLLSAHRDYILRIKGLVSLVGEGAPVLVQAVAGVMSEPQKLKSWPSADHRTRLVVFLDGMQQEFVQDLFAGFMNIPQPGVADRKALIDNPLAVPGMPKIS